MTPITLPSPAKINLFLHIVGRRTDGYHQLQTAFQFIDFCDEMTFIVRKDSDISVQVQNFNIPLEQNLITRAARLLQEKTNGGQGIDVKVDKRIPLGGGLGGGSSNAATTLIALNYLWDLHLPAFELRELGLQLGADVPIFIYGEAAFAQGIGEEFQPIHPAQEWVLLLFPPCKVETGKIFSDSQLTRNTPEITITKFFENGGRNDCEPVVRKQFPEIAEALDCLSRYTTARITGTGSSVFATFKDKEAALEVANKIPASFNGIVVKGLNNSPLHEAIRKNNWGVAKR